MQAAESVCLVERDADGVNTAFRADVLEGLSQAQKAIPARWFYDDAGSQLFEDITRLPEYYPTRAETEILQTNGAEFSALIGPGRAVVEFGSGSSVKTPLLLQAIDPAAYVPLDIAGDFLRLSAKKLAKPFPHLLIYPVEADFTQPVNLPDAVGTLPKLGFFPGSTIGNMDAPAAVDLLRSMRETLGDGALLLIGMDLIKDEQTLIAAYDDAAQVTAAFNRNVIVRINRELGGTIPLGSLRHKACWNDLHARIEMHLVALEDIGFTVAGAPFFMRKGETIHTENSHKFDRRSQTLLLLAGGWTPQRYWLDEAGQFSLVLASVSPARMAP